MTTLAVPPSTSIDTPMFWAVQRGSASAVVCTGIAVPRAADSSVVAVSIGAEPKGLEEWTASIMPATRTAITPTAITQVSCRRSIAWDTSVTPLKVPARRRSSAILRDPLTATHQSMSASVAGEIKSGTTL